MKILIAPDKFKHSLTAAQAADAIARGVRRALPHAHIELCPIADGGEGTIDALTAATGGEIRSARVSGPLGEPVVARWGFLGDDVTAVIEIAQAAGLALVPEDRRDPTKTTTFGVGELILHSLDAGASRIIVGLGGSATCDGGAGMAQALGATFELDGAGPLSRPISGGDLSRLVALRLDSIRPDACGDRIVVACDVNNPLLGPTGAATVFAPQKGATPAQVVELETGLARLATLVTAQKPGLDPAFAGAGAAGGLGFGLVAFCDATVRRGIDLVLDAVRFHERLKDADLVLTGEGRLDGQSLHGKATMGVAAAAHRAGVPCIALVGSVGDGADATLDPTRGGHLSDYASLVENLGVSEPDARQRAAELLQDLAYRVLRKRPDGQRPGQDSNLRPAD